MEKVFQITLSENEEFLTNSRKYQVKILPLNIIKTKNKDKKGKSLWRIKPTGDVHYNQVFISNLEILKSRRKDLIEAHIKDMMHGIVDKLMEEIDISLN